MGTNNMKDNHEEITDDVYSVIRSAEIRDFLRNEAELDIFEEELIILQSYIPMQQKLAMLKQLSETGNAEEAGQINETYGILSEYMSQIYNPTVRTIFLLENEWPYLEDGSIKEKSGFVAACDTVDELIELMEEYSEDGMGMNVYGYITVVQVPQDEKLKEAFGFTLFWIDEKWQIKDIDIFEEKSLRARGVSWDILSMLMNGGGERRYPLPFEDGSRLKLQLPFMEEPFYGILSSIYAYGSNVNAYGWYYNLYDENSPDREDHVNGISLTYIQIDVDSRYSSLDWIERA